MKKAGWLMAALVLGIPCAANAQAVVTERTLGASAAAEAAMGAIEACRKLGQHVTVTVLDHAGRTRAMLRDDGTNPHTVQHSLNKAYTALTYRTSSGEYGKRAASEFPASSGPLHLEKITTSPGGLVIRAGKDIVGAIGVSGTPGSAGGGGGDEKCAQAGIDKIAKGLGG